VQALFVYAPWEDVIVGVVYRPRIVNHVLRIENISEKKAFSNDAGPDTDSEVMVCPRSDGPEFLTCTVWAQDGGQGDADPIGRSDRAIDPRNGPGSERGTVRGHWLPVWTVQPGCAERHLRLQGAS
jgi:hypothetical protein